MVMGHTHLCVGKGKKSGCHSDARCRGDDGVRLDDGSQGGHFAGVHVAGQDGKVDGRVLGEVQQTARSAVPLCAKYGTSARYGTRRNIAVWKRVEIGTLYNSEETELESC